MTRNGDITIHTDPTKGPRLDITNNVPTPPPFMARGLCATTDPEAFFPEKGGSTREAKRVCAVCPVQAECLDYAIANNERYGIWGGLSERERRKIAATIHPTQQPETEPAA